MNEELLKVWNALGVIFVEDQDELNAILDYFEVHDIDCVVHPTDAGWTVSRE